MSFGFGVGGFLAVGKLSLHLWRSFKDAPREFEEIRRELSSINIVIADLSDQAATPTSLLNRRGASRKEEVMALCDNLMGVLEELQETHRKFRNMGKNAWMRVRLGERDLQSVRSKLSLHIGLIETFVASLTMASVGRMEPMMVEVLRIVQGMARGHGAGADSLLNAQNPKESDDGRRALERELRSEGVSKKFIKGHMDDIMTLVDEVVDVEMLGNFSELQPHDSVSQTGGRYQTKRRHSIASDRTHDLPQQPTQTPFDASTLKNMLEEVSEEEIREATRFLANHGYNVDQIRQRTEEYGEKALCLAAHYCNNTAVLLILRKNVNINTPTQIITGTPIYRAIAGLKNDSKTTSTIRILLQLGCDPNLEGPFVTKLSGSRGSVIVETPSNSGAIAVGAVKGQWGYRNVSNLFAAIWRYKIDAAKLLIEQGADVHARVEVHILDVFTGTPEWTITALHAAAFRRNAPMVKLLLDRGSSANSCRPCTPLDWCYMHTKGRDSETEMILEAAGGVSGEMIGGVTWRSNSQKSPAQQTPTSP